MYGSEFIMMYGSLEDKAFEEVFVKMSVVEYIYSTRHHEKTL